MKPVHVVLTVVLALFSFSLVAWLGRSQQVAPAANSQPNLLEQPKRDTPTPLLVPAKGPYGKAVAVDPRFDFGAVETGDTGSHTFVIKNEGPGPLRVKAGGTSCPQCTVGKVSRKEDEDIAPGETVDVTITWKISQVSGRFRQTALIYTTDPDNQKIEFGIQGMIEATLNLVPSGQWPMGNLREGKPTTIDGYLYSNVINEIVINKYECTNPHMTVTWEPADAKTLAEKSAKSGLKISVTVAPETSIGPLREHVKLHTAVKDGTVVEFDVTGNRPGPIEVKGRKWFAGSNVLDFGEFECTAGAKANLKMYVQNMEGEFEAQQVVTEGQHARATVSPTGKSFGESKIYDLTVEIPPGPPAVHHAKESEPIVLKVNHPTVNEFKFFLDYHAK